MVELMKKSVTGEVMSGGACGELCCVKAGFVALTEVKQGRLCGWTLVTTG